MKTWTCSICGKDHDNLTSYMECVSKCYEKAKKEEEKETEAKRVQEINAALNGVKQAKSYYEQKLNEFKEKYPKEYELNFGCECNSNDNPCSDCDAGCPCEGENCSCRIDHGCTGNGDCFSKDDIENMNYMDGMDKFLNAADNLKKVSSEAEALKKEMPVIKVKLNGKDVTDDYIEKIFADPNSRHIAKLLGIL